MSVATRRRPAAVAGAAAATPASHALARLAENFVEAGWLTVIVFATLMFQAITLRSFDFPKAIWLQILTPWLWAGAIVAFALRCGTRSPDHPSLPRRVWLPPVLIAGGTAASYGISTALSIAPNVSFWGSRFNTEGMATALCYLSVFLLVALMMRRPDQLERAIDVILLVSIPVCLYGFAQRFGMDPLAAYVSGGEAYTGRVTSVFGQPVYAAGFAAMVMPLTLMRLVRLLGGGQGGRAAVGVFVGARAIVPMAAVLLLAGLFLIGAARTPQLWWAAPVMVAAVGFAGLLTAVSSSQVTRPLALGTYAALLGIQIVFFAFAWSRGPLVALPTATGIALFLYIGGIRGLAALCVGIFLSAFTLANVSLAGLRTLQERGVVEAGLVQSTVGLAPPVAALSEGGSPAGRSIVWRDASKLVLAGREIGGGPDPLQSLRPVLGYGPETLAITFETVATAQARAIEPRRLSRAHNELLDIAVNRGLLGLAGWIALMLVLIGAAWRACATKLAARSAVSAGVAGTLAAYTIQQLFEPTDPSLSTYFWLAAGMLLCGAIRSPGSSLEASRPTMVALRPGKTGKPRPSDEAEGSVRRRGVPAAARWVVGTGIVGSGVTVVLVALLTTNYDIVGWLTIGWLAAALVALAVTYLPSDGLPPADEVRRTGLLSIPLLLIVALLSFGPFRRLEADVFSKYGLDAAIRGDVANALALGRAATLLGPENELYFSNLARVMANAANAAPDRPVRPSYAPSMALLYGAQPQDLAKLSKKELLVLIRVVLDRAAALVPLEPDNHQNLAIVHRALGDLGEPGSYDAARSQLQVLRKLSPTEGSYQQQLTQLDGRGP